MHPYHFVAILGSDSEGDWAVLTGRSNRPVNREPCQNGNLRLSPAHPFGTVTGKARQKKGERRAQMKKAGIVLGAVRAGAVFGLGTRQWRKC